MKLKALNDNILVKPVAQESKSGLVLTAESKEETYIAEVIAVAGDVNNIKAGDRILFSKYQKAIKVKIDEVTHYVMKCNEVLAVMG